MVTIDKVFETAQEYVNAGDYEGATEELLRLGDLSDQIRLLVNDQHTFIKGHELELVQLLQSIYNESSFEVIPDSSYDELYDYINRKGMDVVGTQVEATGTVYQHKYPELRGTLDKVHFITETERGKDKKRSLEAWLNYVEKTVGRPLQGKEQEAVAFAKWDGVSAVLEGNEDGDGLVNRALKRGYTNKNEATAIGIMKGLPLPLNKIDLPDSPIGIKTEVVMMIPDFEQYCKKYGKMKSPRSTVTSIVNSDDATIDQLKYLTIIPLQMVTPGGDINPRVPGSINEDYAVPIHNIKDTQEVEKVLEQIQKHAKKDGYPIDGIVIRLLDKTIQQTMGRKEAINKFEVAYKLPTQRTVTRVVGIEYSLGDLGAVTPVLQVEPVVMEGNTVSNISLGSFALLEAKDLHMGDLVELSYNIIPYIERVQHMNEGPKIKIVNRCPVCDHELVMGVTPICTNPNCEGRIKGLIINYIKKMKIENILYATVSDLFNAGLLHGITDLYTLHERALEISSMPGYGAVSTKRILDGIEKRKQVTSAELLGSLGIKGAGRRIFKKILTTYTMDQLLESLKKPEELAAQLSSFEGIGEITADVIIQGLTERVMMIKELRNHLTIVDEAEESDDYVMSVCFTKIRDKDFEEYLKQNQIKVVDKYRKGLTYMIVPDPMTTSSKIEKAKKDGVKILPILEAYKITGYH